jgi:hypothetical protein
MTWSLANVVAADAVAALLKKPSEYNIPDYERALCRADAEAIIHAALWAYGVRSGSFASAYAFENLYNALGLASWTFKELAPPENGEPRR